MKLRFKLDQAEAFRRGIDAPKSTVHIEVTPAELPDDVRAMIADRMEGIDVCRLVESATTPGRSFYKGQMIESKTPDLEGLLQAVREDEERVRPKGKKQEGALANFKA